MMDLLNPGFKAIHHDPPDKPIECVVLFAQHFQSAIYPTEFTVPEYDEWLLAADAADRLRVPPVGAPAAAVGVPRAVAAQDAAARALDSTRSTRPIPTRRIVITHRDPVKCVASVLSLVDSLSGTFTDVDHRDVHRRHWPG